MKEIIMRKFYKSKDWLTESDDPEAISRKLEKIKTLLESIDPDCCYPEWLRALMAIFNESNGSEEGFDIANEWSSQGRKYKGEYEIRYKWGTFRLGSDNPITIATLVKMARDGELD